MLHMPAEDCDHDENMRVTRGGRTVGMPRAIASFQRFIRKVVIRRDRHMACLDTFFAAYLIRFLDVIVPGNPFWDPEHI